MGSILVTGMAVAAVTAGQNSKVSSSYCAGSSNQLVLHPDRTGGGSRNVHLEAGDDIFIKPISYHDLGFCFWLCSLRTLLPHPPYNSKNYLIFV